MITGKAKGKVLKGRISKLDILYSDAYELAVQNGFEGTVEEWLATIKGEDGVSPTVTIFGFDGGHRVGITGKDYSRSFDVMDGKDYVLTKEDKEEIAVLVLAEFPVYEGEVVEE